MTTRRELLAGGAALAALGSATWPLAAAKSSVLKPPRLELGDRVGMINPARAAFRREPVEIQTELLEAVGLVPVKGENFYKRRGYLAGTDEERAADINGFFADSSIWAIMGIGGWGSARVLPLLDYDVIRANPKPVIGISDVTALLVGIQAKTGLVTFHGPHLRIVYSADYFKRVLFDGEEVLFSNPREIKEDETVQMKERYSTIRSGKVCGRLIGHIRRQFMLPLGIEAEIDADAGTLRMLEAAVV